MSELCHFWRYDLLTHGGISDYYKPDPERLRPCCWLAVKAAGKPGAPVGFDEPRLRSPGAQLKGSLLLPPHPLPWDVDVSIAAGA